MTERGIGVRVWGECWRVLLALLLGLTLLMFTAGSSVPLDGSDAQDLLHGVVLIAGFSSLGAVAALLVLVSVATRRRWNEIGAIVAAGLVSLVTVETFGLYVGEPAEAGSEILVIIVYAAVMAAAVATGWAIGSRRELVASLRERARLAEAEQQLRLAQAREHERTRIAREMHDVLAHQLSLVAMHASVLRHRSDLSREQTAEAVAVVHERAGLALDDLRQVLGVLRDPQAAAEAAPQPSLADLDALLAEEPTARLELLVDVAAVPPTIGRHAYRIVQECLTNARRHAPGRAVSVRLDGAPGERLRIDVRNSSDSAPSGAGYGLIGIDERARSVGGTSAVSTDDGEHVVIVELPWGAA